MRIALFAVLLLLASRTSSFAASVCVVSAAEDVIVCDGKTIQKLDDATAAFTLALKQTIEKGYKVVSQGGGDKYDEQIWTLVKE